MIRPLQSLTLVALFTAAPLYIFPLLGSNARLDLVDYYEAGMAAKVENRLGGTSELTFVSDTLLTLRTTASTMVQLRMPNDTTITITNIYQLPEGEFTKVKHYTTDWEKIH